MKSGNVTAENQMGNQVGRTKSGGNYEAGAMVVGAT